MRKANPSLEPQIHSAVADSHNDAVVRNLIKIEQGSLLLGGSGGVSKSSWSSLAPSSSKLSGSESITIPAETAGIGRRVGGGGGVHEVMVFG